MNELAFFFPAYFLTAVSLSLYLSLPRFNYSLGRREKKRTPKQNKTTKYLLFLLLVVLSYPALELVVDGSSAVAFFRFFLLLQSSHQHKYPLLCQPGLSMLANLDCFQ